jgi:N-acetylmuramic acid 6-phosphate etherase
MVLNMLSTGAMAKMGYIYGNLMVNLHLKNVKLAARGISIVQWAAGLDRAAARSALKAAGNDVPIALVMLKAGVTQAQAAKALKITSGHVRKAIVLAQKKIRE